jgi:hypothetical protein
MDGWISYLVQSVKGIDCVLWMVERVECVERCTRKGGGVGFTLLGVPQPWLQYSDLTCTRVGEKVQSGQPQDASLIDHHDTRISRPPST